MQKQFLRAFVPVLVVVAAVYASFPQSSITIAVDAGKLDRRDTLVSFELPAAIRGPIALSDDSGSRVALRIDTNNRATFLVRELKAVETKHYRILTENDGRVSNRVETTSDSGRLHITADGRPVLDYRLKGELPRADMKPSFLRAGYIHPAYTPAGRVVTDDYPGDHPHQDGIFFGWTKTEFEGRHPDFWNIGDGTGKIELDALENTWSGPVHGGFEARLRYVDLSGPAPKAALQELWKVTAYRAGMFDLVSTQQCVTDSPLLLPEYRYGGLGIRGHREWKNKENVSFLTSEGKDLLNSTGYGMISRLHRKSL
jgi:methane monooxygenase PmoA-like